MKTPREILLAHHRAAGPKLDAIRRSVLAESRPVAAPWPQAAAATIFQTLWRELVLPSRRLWSGLAAAWLLIVVVNVSQRDNVSNVTGKTVQSGGLVMSLQAQQRWMYEHFADRSLPMDAEPPKTFSPKPRTQTISFFTT